MDEKQIAAYIGISKSTLRMRKGNHSGSLKSTKTIDLVHKKYASLTCSELRARVLLLLRKSGP